MLKSGHSILEAGQNIYLNGGFEIEKGAMFYAGINVGLMSEADRGCQSACINPANTFSPDGDGTSDYWVFGQSFVNEYSIEVFNRWDQLIYSSASKSIYSNSVVYAWDGTGATSSGTYTIIITYKDCYGNTHVAPPYYVGVTGLKSAEIINEENTVTNDKINNLKMAQICVFPNPIRDNVTINYTGDSFPIQYKISDMKGKTIIKKQTYSENEQVSLKELVTGSYIINVKAGEYNLVQKLIKE